METWRLATCGHGLHRSSIGEDLTESQSTTPVEQVPDTRTERFSTDIAFIFRHRLQEKDICTTIRTVSLSYVTYIDPAEDSDSL